MVLVLIHMSKRMTALLEYFWQNSKTSQMDRSPPIQQNKSKKERAERKGAEPLWHRIGPFFMSLHRFERGVSGRHGKLRTPTVFVAIARSLP
jgi:hypothetical protein